LIDLKLLCGYAQYARKLQKWAVRESSYVVIITPLTGKENIRIFNGLPSQEKKGGLRRAQSASSWLGSGL